MPIIIANPKIVPELVYNKVYILNFSAKQELGQKQKFTVMYEYILYAEKEDGSKVFDDTSRKAETIIDFEKEIKDSSTVEEQIALANTVTAIEDAVASLISIRQHIESSVNVEE